jgi:predicted  nucleic acid-binding Zn-ribbon protein
MSIVNAFKNAIWESEEPTQQTQQPAPTVKPVSGGTSVGTGVNAEMVQAIKTNTLNRKTPYTALLEAAEKLASVIPDQVTRLKAAYAMVGEQRTVGAILQAIDVHISDVDGERLRFNQASDQRRKTELSSLTAASQQLAEANKSMNGEIAAMQERIRALTDSIITNEGKVSELTAQLNSRTLEFDLAVQQFDAATNTVRAELEQQRAAISSTLTS